VVARKNYPHHDKYSFDTFVLSSQGIIVSMHTFLSWNNFKWTGTLCILLILTIEKSKFNHPCFFRSLNRIKIIDGDDPPNTKHSCYWGFSDKVPLFMGSLGLICFTYPLFLLRSLYIYIYWFIGKAAICWIIFFQFYEKTSRDPQLGFLGLSHRFCTHSIIILDLY